MRQIKQIPSAVEVDTTKAGKRIELEVELLTRLFGGGAEARKLDKVCWLRATAVKASLRFWWRAIHGCRHKTSQEMWQAESEIFGSPAETDRKTKQVTGGPGMVKVEVHGNKAQNSQAPNPGQGSALNVAYFPATMSKNEQEILGKPGSRAKVVVAFSPGISPEIEAQVKNALCCTLIFGGAGSRTRRGAGAIGLVSLADAAKIGFPLDAKGLTDYLKSLPKSGGARDFFCLGNGARFLVGSSDQEGEQTQEKALAVWKNFRQLRRSGGGAFGRSMWPEGDVIRRMANTHSQHHPPRKEYTNQAPRALLGLPIGIKFKDEKDGDPGRSEIVLANGSDRYASPVWIGVTRIWEGTQPKCIPVVLATEARLPCEVIIGGRPRNPLVAIQDQAAPKNHPDDPDAITVTSPAHMVERVAEAFQSKSFTLVS